LYNDREFFVQRGEPLKCSCPGPDTEASWIKALREFGENFSFPMQNFSSVSAGRNRDDLEERVKLALCDRFAA
jgi:hypothetical protein